MSECCIYSSNGKVMCGWDYSSVCKTFHKLLPFYATWRKPQHVLIRLPFPVFQAAASFILFVYNECHGKEKSNTSGTIDNHSYISVIQTVMRIPTCCMMDICCHAIAQHLF